MFSIFVFDDLYFVDLVVVDFVLCKCSFSVLFVVFSPVFHFDFLSTSENSGWEECPRND